MSAEELRELIAQNNSGYAKEHKPSIRFKDFPKANIPVIVCCADPRSNASEFLQLGEDGPPVIRVAGGRAKGAMPSLEALSTIMGYGTKTLSAVAIFHHTDCGIGPDNFDEKHIARRLKELGKEASEHADELKGQDWNAFRDLEGSIREDVALIKSNPFFHKDLEVIGFKHDIATGEVTEVV